MEDTGEYGANGIRDIENFVIFSRSESSFNDDDDDIVEETVWSFDSLDVLDTPK